MDLATTAAVAFGAAFLSLLAVLALSRALEPRDAAGRRRLEQRISPVVFLFRDGRLIDATRPARRLAEQLPSVDLAGLAQWLGPRLPRAAEALAGLPGEGRIELLGEEGRGSMRLALAAEDLGDGVLRVTLTDPRAEGAGVVVDTLSQSALEDEAATLREAMDGAPVLCWREDAAGDLVWANAAYLAAADAVLPDHPAWPLPVLFDLPPTLGREGVPQRQGLGPRNGGRWYDCHARDCDGGGRMLFALPADDAVRAERSLREFVQTLTKTFADLPIGLAVFDRERNLQLFNPALIDLTGLPTAFLAARPSLFTLLDRLREARMVPEPKDYRSWRNHMSTLEAAAASGHHVETWSLPGGHTYRVTGRPHPDGAIAFLFEDITSEMSMTRNFRAQLSLGAQVVDTLEEALGVFGPDGQMLLGNEAWRRLFGAETMPLARRLADFAAAGGPGAQKLAETVVPGARRAIATGAMVGPDGALLSWRATPLGGGQWMLGFSPNPVAAHGPAERARAARAEPEMRSSAG